MPILSFKQVHLAYGLKPLLKDVSFTIDAGERICLLGRNGEGKSSLLKLVCGEQQPDSGEIWKEDGLKVGLLRQDLPYSDERTVFDVVASGCGELGSLLAEYHALASQQLEGDGLAELARIQHELEARDGWQMNQIVEQVITRLKLPAEARMHELSGGWKRRVLLGRALAGTPDLLVLDEPTNHLDIPAIQWLENQLLQFRGALLFVSHDRSFIRKIGGRIIELDRGVLSSWPGNYDSYLVEKEKRLEEEARNNALFDKKLAEEEAWIRQGIKARRTRNEGRVRALKTLRAEREKRTERKGKVRIEHEKASLTGKMVVEASNISFGYEGRWIIRHFSTTVFRGDRIGLIGENGCGKSTLVKLLLGQIAPQEGKVRLGTNLEVAYFDQNRAALNESMSVADNIAEGREFIEINGKKKHVVGYLGDFLFEPERARTPVSALSGGEKNRLLLAKIFSKPSNVLVLDEPTNDLDVETLELLEEVVSEYSGTVLIISHDREFLDRTVTSVMAFEGEGEVSEYVGGYEDWLRQGKGFPSVESRADTRSEERKVPARAESGGLAAKDPQQTESVPPRKKMSFKYKRELEQLPGQIERLEQEKAELEKEIAAPAFYERPHEEVSRVLELLSEKQAALDALMERWLELEEMSE